jgi:dTDP-4-dehydrorhamnose reductase
MKILIVGSSGMLGSELKKALEWHELLTPTSQELNLKNEYWINEYVAGHKPELIINAAVNSSVDGCETDARETLFVNTLGVESLAKIAAIYGARFIHYSSDYVFSGRDKTAYDETFKTEPISVYGKSKAEAERRIEFLGAHFGLDYLVIRTSWLFGRGRDSFIEFFLKKLATSPIEEKVFVVNDQVSTPTLAKDLAAATALLISQNIRGLVHFANAGAVSKLEIMNEVCGWMRKNYPADERFVQSRLGPQSYKSMPWKAERPQYTPLATNLYQRIAGQSPRRWQDALYEHLEDIRDTKIKAVMG